MPPGLNDVIAGRAHRESPRSLCSDAKNDAIAALDMDDYDNEDLEEIPSMLSIPTTTDGQSATPDSAYETFKKMRCGTLLPLLAAQKMDVKNESDHDEGFNLSAGFEDENESSGATTVFDTVRKIRSGTLLPMKRVETTDDEFKITNIGGIIDNERPARYSLAESIPGLVGSSSSIRSDETDSLDSPRMPPGLTGMLLPIENRTTSSSTQQRRVTKASFINDTLRRASQHPAGPSSHLTVQQQVRQRRLTRRRFTAARRPSALESRSSENNKRCFSRSPSIARVNPHRCVLKEAISRAEDDKRDHNFDSCRERRPS